MAELAAVRRAIGELPFFSPAPACKPLHGLLGGHGGWNMRLCSVVALLCAILLEIFCLRYAHADPAANRNLQRLLVWSGDYPGPIDGDLGPRTMRAMGQFQRRHGEATTAAPSARIMQALISEAKRRRDEVDFRYGIEPLTGVSIGLPHRLVPRNSTAKRGARFTSIDDVVEIETIKFSGAEFTLSDLFLRLREIPNRQVYYEAERSNWFVLTGIDLGRTGAAKRFYVRIHTDGQELRGFSVAYPDQLHAQLEHVVAVMSLDFDAFPSPSAITPPPSDASGQGGPHQPLPKQYTSSSGTAFAVGRPGLFMTNAHVVEGCSALLLPTFGTATLVKQSRELDLALVQAKLATALPIPIAADDALLGEEVFALGYPLQDILQNGLNLTSGVVSSLSGLGGDGHGLQMTVPTQPGNSGGPLMDRYGRVVGVVNAKLNAKKVADIANTIPEGISFAVKARTVRGFLSDQSLELAHRARSERKIADIAREVMAAVVPIYCVSERRN